MPDNNHSTKPVVNFNSGSDPDHPSFWKDSTTKN